MTKLEQNLILEKCPCCNVDLPRFKLVHTFETNNTRKEHHRYWRVYSCSRCGGAILAYSYDKDGVIREMLPRGLEIDEHIPDRAQEYLNQALNSLCAPAGSVILSASSVDAMLKSKGYKEGNLYSRIDKAAEEHLITDEMAKWAHEIRLDANEQRHADEEAPLPSSEDAQKCIEFALALAEFLFVLPARVSRGLEKAKEKSD